LKAFTVAGTFEAGHYEYDSGLALIHLEDAQRLYRLEGPSGVQLKLRDAQLARGVAQELAAELPQALRERDWTRTHRNCFDVIVPAIERALGVSFLPGSIYLISRMPSDPQMGDVVPIATVSLALAFLATLYPSWRASRVNPAQALRYE
ncbi:MAG: lipoprotein-releasing system transmembrane subunit LolC, partial [Aquabacterium sp.]|nr:lipoprotein-releasing system transmembrane subunit LolC [Aquabacterium sp.]